MNIGLLGYGRMGKAIETIAINRGHQISLKIDSEQGIDFTNTDVAIDFSLPHTAVDNIKKALSSDTPVISGTTGWLEKYDEVKSFCESQGGTFLYASNFSLGVNIFFELNRVLAKLLQQHPDYKVSIEEIHHTKKLDAPSGTAISLAQGIINQHENLKQWSMEDDSKNTLPISAKRIPDVPGTHTVNYDSTIDSIEIKHTAHCRQGFALGAVVAAEWIVDKKGIFTMNDVLNIT